MLAHTPLYANHLALNAHMVDFHGWRMPLHYGSQLEEHHAVRQHAGLFDVSHMTIVDILGAGGRQFLKRLLVSDIDRLTHKGKALYTCMCNEHGGIIDDLIVYQRQSDSFRLILNSATRERDLSWIQAKSEGFAIGLQERSDLAIIAVQGPEAIQHVMNVVTPSEADAISTLTPFESVEIDDNFFARTGYTGEDGLEIMMPAHKMISMWESLIQQGVTPCGLGSRDTLRLEAGLLLYGQDMDETTTPLESGLSWIVHWEPEDRNFIGMGALISLKETGVHQQFVGLMLEDKGIMRAHQTVYSDGKPIGTVTSGSFSPTLNTSIALARIPIHTGRQLEVDIRGKRHNVRIVKPRFVKRGKLV